LAIKATIAQIQAIVNIKFTAILKFCTVIKKVTALSPASFPEKFLIASGFGITHLAAN
jgi:hypothetical protein